MADANAGGAAGSPQTPANGQVPNGGAAGSATTPTGDNQGGDAGGGEGDRTYTAAEVAAIRREAAENRTKRTAAEKRLQEIEDAQKSELQKAQEKAASEETTRKQLEGELNAVRLNNAVTSALASTALYPDLVVGKINTDAIGFDPATGKVDPALLAKEVARVTGAYPALFRASDQGGDAGANGQTPKTDDMNALIRGSRR